MATRMSMLRLILTIGFLASSPNVHRFFTVLVIAFSLLPFYASEHCKGQTRREAGTQSHGSRT